MSDCMKWDVAIALHPVQHFISNSRKTQDLCMASQSISQLFQVIKANLDPSYGKLKIPNGERVAGGKKGIPHEGLFQLNGSKEEILQALEKTEGELNIFWKKTYEQAYKEYCKILGNLSEGISEEYLKIWEKQCQRYFRLYYAALPSQGEGLNFSEITSLLAAVKNTRSFSPYIGDSRVKCTLCGEFEQIGPVDRQEMRKHWLKLEQKRPSLFDQGEYLCGVCLTKRLGRVDRFPSIASVAYYYLKFKVVENSEKKVVQEFFLRFEAYCTSLSSFLSKQKNSFLSSLWSSNIEIKKEGKTAIEQKFLEIDGQFLLPEMDPKSFVPDEEENKRAFSGPDTLTLCPPNNLLKERENLCDYFWEEVVVDLGLSKVKHFALLMMDVDSLGETMTKCESSEDLSERVLDFVQNQVFDLVENQYSGRLIYAGGDDLLAFLPFHTAFDCALELRSQFQAKISETTISGVLVYSHIRENLRHIVRYGRERLKEAKNWTSWAKDPGRENRNVMAFFLSRQSGKQIFTLLPWDRKKGTTPPLENMKWISSQLSFFSKTIVHDLSKRFERSVRDAVRIDDHGFAEGLPEQYEGPKNPLETEIGICLRRQFNGKEWSKSGKDKKEMEIFLKYCTSAIYQLYEDSPSFEHFLQTLKLCVFLNQGIDLE